MPSIRSVPGYPRLGKLFFGLQFSFHTLQAERPLGFEANEALEQDVNWSSQCLQGMLGLGGTCASAQSARVNICYRFTGNRTESRDLTQDVFPPYYRTFGEATAQHTAASPLG